MSPLPVLEYRNKIIDALKQGKNLVITAPTGSGKSTQVPQILLDFGSYAGRILVLQPRRLAARMLADRIARERGGEPGGEIGFQTRFETRVSESTRVFLMTEGILPRMLLSNRNLDGVSTIIFDEFHERNLATDIGLAVAADLQRKRRSDLRLIVMSATIDPDPVAAYLGNAEIIGCPGRLYPVDIQYSSVPKAAPPWAAAAGAVRSLISGGAEGDILVFMPGAYEIRRTLREIDATVRGENVTAVSLYGDLPSAKQHEVMEATTRRKIIVATNIAETSLTIPGVRHVVDSGLARVNRFDAARGCNMLFVEPVSQASADQRSGRAGREGPGSCIRLWSAVQQGGRAGRTTPEILRVDLAETVLHLRMLGFSSMEEVPWFEAPDGTALRSARELLGLLGAFAPDGSLTARGEALCAFPMHPRLACLLIDAGKRRAVHLATFAAAVLSERPAIAGKPDFPDEALRRDVVSDFYGQYCLLDKIRKSGYDPSLCTRHAVNGSAARAIYRTRTLFLQYCRRAGMDLHDGEDAPAALCRSLLAAYPDHLCIRKDRGTLLCTMRDNRRGELDKNSTVRRAELFVAADIRETRTPNAERKTVLSLAAGIKEEWLHEDFSDAWDIRSFLEWNPATASVEARTQMSCLGTVISDEPDSAAADPAAVAELLAATIAAKRLKIDTWDAAVEEWIGRVGWVAERFPQMNLPVFSDEVRGAVIRRMCEGERRYETVRRKPVLPFLQGMLGYGQYEFLNRMAPEQLPLPSGRKLRIKYAPGSAPRGRSGIQELYGLKESPVVAGGKERVLIEILAPNNRPVQITDDIARFWEVHYPDVKKALSRRYPKHEWR